jgi:F-type H+-transporting ATPase subunit b
MLIDWFTVIAQLVNFLILVLLLKRFLYTPILNAIDAREKRIAAGLADAEVKQGEAQRELDEFKHKSQEFDQQRKALLSAVTLEVQTERQRLLLEARKEFEALRIRQQEAMRNDFHNLKDEINRRTQGEVFAIARKTLDDLAAESLEERMVEAFIHRCRTLKEEEKNSLQNAFGGIDGEVLVRSTFPLPETQQKAIEVAVREMFTFDGPFHFDTSPDLVSGIALSMNGYEVTWSIADYLLALEQHVVELLAVQPSIEDQKESQPGASKPESQPETNPEHGVNGDG